MSPSTTKTEQQMVELETSLRHQEALLAEYTRLAALGQITQGVGHEIGNLLAIVVAWTAQLKGRLEKTDVDPKIREILTKLDSATARLVAIVQSVSMCVRGARTEDLTPHSLHDVLQHAVEISRPKLRMADATLRYEPTAQPLMVSMRPGQIVHAVTSLLHNAADAVDGHTERWVELAAKQDREHTIITVTDSGRGLSPHVRARLFEQFFSTKSPGLAHGLGLSTTKTIMTAHGGTVSVTEHSSPTCFVLSLPTTRRSV